MILYRFQAAACLDIEINSHNNTFNRADMTYGKMLSFNYILIYMPGVIATDWSIMMFLLESIRVIKQLFSTFIKIKILGDSKLAY